MKCTGSTGDDNNDACKRHQRQHWESDEELCLGFVCTR